ncbi:MAG TPA: cytochrome c [Vicinamibacterales bacterium]|nr:cytochrome c [Vicinamibacterales bacterium]
MARGAARMKPLIVLMAVVWSVVAATAQTKYPYDTVSSVVLPKGDVQAGRKAFQDLKCHVCHRVSGERGFAVPIAELRGPDLSGLLQLQETSDIAAAIIAPSHSLSIRTSEAIKAQLAKQGASPMGDFSRAMTVRQLADLLSYLRSVR